MEPNDDAPRQLVLAVGRDINRMARETFFTGDCNRAARAEIDRAAAWDGLPRVLTGPPGSGKTHLAVIFALDLEALGVPARALREDTIRAAADAPAVVLDDAHLLAGTPETEELAFHLFNQVRNSGRPLLITGRGPVAGWGLRLPDLASRLMGCLAVRLDSPDEATLRMVLAKRFADRQLAVSAKTLEYAAIRMERSFAAAETLVAELDRANLHRGNPISFAMVRDALAATSPDPDPSDPAGGPE